MHLGDHISEGGVFRKTLPSLLRNESFPYIVVPQMELIILYLPACNPLHSPKAPDVNEHQDRKGWVDQIQKLFIGASRIHLIFLIQDLCTSWLCSEGSLSLILDSLLNLSEIQNFSSVQ